MKTQLRTLLVVLLAAGFGWSIHAADLTKAEVQKIWKKDCAVCHGEDGKGETRMGKRLHVEDYTSPKVQEKLKEDAMIKIIKEGKVVDGRRRMKAYASTLKDDEIKALVKHIREFKKAQ